MWRCTVRNVSTYLRPRFIDEKRAKKWNTNLAIATETTKCHLAASLLETGRRSATAGRGLRNRGGRMSRRGNSRVVAGDRNGSSTAGLRSAVSHGGRVEAELDA
jgi:hypothetical protein